MDVAANDKADEEERKEVAQQQHRYDDGLAVVARVKQFLYLHGCKKNISAAEINQKHKIVT